jgi:tetratricopeptide (TPR) repeat protein
MMAQHRYQAAIEAYRLVAAPTPSVWNKMGIAQQMMFNLKAAALCYQASLRLNPNNSHVLNNLGTVYDSQQLYADAEKMYRRSIRISAGSAVAWKNLGTVLLARHNFKDGWEAYRHALALDPKTFEDRLTPKALNPRTTHDRGVLNYYMARGCVHAGQNDCAIDYLRKALNEGVTDEKHIAADDEFAVLRSDPAFRQLLASQQPQ